ncbi:MAG: hypothetical protein KatS3mg033_0997 [Thermonema sp.]|uniref:DUF445 domain-containing protein n=1 Tax=Thermonema sp. TaxID=2231181 RepID=UPI0021DE8118|nr:hypothetical protein [Thermonema sp.]GIV39197.1 MAG: hypothetical protein KatS3mg033_0997 [Thermonema sp.]
MEDIDWLRLLSLLSIPLISGFIGWFTNWLALKMTFYPIEYVGFPPFGWQGIIPGKAHKMAARAVDMITGKLLRIEERFARLDPQRVAEEMQPALEHISRKIVDEVMQSQAAGIWERTPDFVKNRIYKSISAELPHITVQMMEDLKQHITEVLDIKALSIKILLRDKALLNRIFQECGKEEFKFIERSGFYFGALFGLPQAVISYFYAPWWLLPLAGLIVGYVTNWLALKLIFYPLYPKKYLFGLVTYQGLFLKRQKEVAEAYAKIVSEEIVSVENMAEFVVRGPGAEKLARLIEKHVETLVEHTVGDASVAILRTLAADRVEAIKNIVTYRFMEELPISVRRLFAYAEDALSIEEELRERMKALPPPEFERFLHPIFEEDETTLIIVGAVLGGIAGLIQYYLLFVL